MPGRHSTGFKNVGMMIDIKPMGKTGDTMDLSVHCRIGRKRFQETCQVKLGESFEKNLRHTLHESAEAVVTLAMKGAPEAFMDQD